MRLTRYKRYDYRPSNTPGPGNSRGLYWGRVLAGFVTTTVLTAAVSLGQQASLHQPMGDFSDSVLNRMPDANERMKLQEQQGEQNRMKLEEANATRKKQLGEETAKLLQMAADLKTEMDKTDKDTLSLSIIRKADQIEKLARDLKARMKVTIGQN